MNVSSEVGRQRLRKTVSPHGRRGQGTAERQRCSSAGATGAAGVGAVDAGLIGTFVLFGFPEEQVFAAILIYRLVAFWLPIPPGVVAFFQLRKTVKRWKSDGLPVDRPPQKSLVTEVT